MMSRDVSKDLDQFLQRTIPAQEQEYLSSLSQAGSLQVNQRLSGLERDMLLVKQHITKHTQLTPPASTPAHSLHGAATVALESPTLIPTIPEDDQYLDPSSNILFIRIPGGQLASARASDQTTKIKPPVTIKEFWLGRYPVTQQQWKEITGTSPSFFKNRDNSPVESVSWKDIQLFLKKMNTSGTRLFRLPTALEWQYASLGNAGYLTNEPELDRKCWHSLNSRQGTHKVGIKLPNGFGIRDMFGNVWEWTETPCTAEEDTESSKGSLLQKILSGLHAFLIRPVISTRYRYLCGGSWDCSLKEILANKMICKHIKTRDRTFGFRVAFSE